MVQDIADRDTVIKTAACEKPNTFRNASRNAASAAICKRRREHSTRSKSPTLACNQFSTVLSFEDFNFCRQSLIRTVTKCTDVQFFYLSALLSSLLHCFIPLHRSAIVRVFYLLFATSGSNQENSESRESMLEQLEVICENLLRIDSQGFVHFALPTMKQFLLGYPIRGIDRSHFTLARACIAEIAAEQKLDAAQTEQSRKQTPFSAYAMQNWHRHYRKVQLASVGLTTQAHWILHHQISRRLNLADDHTDHRKKLEHAIRFCEETNLNVLLEKYKQLLPQDECEAFPATTSDTDDDTEGEIIVVSDAFGHMTTGESDDNDENEWILVA